MGEIKSVKVDNWGVFFLQKLQNFFNKTDYCDLTLQFRDNSQLKVHRLVLSACTDYFNVLEQTCEMVDDALIMPNELQADVVVPIVNFMYTGTLEFELKMYGRLLRTAKEMNMTVLLKLLEAHRRTMEGVNKAQRPPSPKTIRRRGPPPVAGSATVQQVQQQRRILSANNVSPQRRGGTQVSTGIPGQKVLTNRQHIGLTAVTRTSTLKQESHVVEGVQTTSSSPFEQLRRGYNNTKRPASTSFESPQAKKPNIEDVKEYSEQQRMRKQISAEFGEDPEFEEMLDDDVHDDNDDEEEVLGATEQTTNARSITTAATTPAVTSGASEQRQKSQPQQPEQATITIKQGVGDQPATIIVKDASNSKMNHTKIISEVLRQYPHLVKGNKNIKLRIMPNSAIPAQKVLIKKEDDLTNCSKEAPTETVQRAPQNHQPDITIKKVQSSPATIQITTSPPKQDQEKPAPSGVTAATTSGCAQKRRIDSKTMHALIALGAENTTGPWLCLHCGVNGRPISIPSYRGFRRHLINTHKEKIDAALCEHCGWRSNNKRELHFHIEQEHKIKSTLYTFPDCLVCSVAFIDSNALSKHMNESHANEEKQQCIYCNKIFAKELQLYQHMRSYHKKQSVQDGIIDYEDEEYLEEVLTQKDKDAEKVKILSNISLPKLEQPSSEAHALSTVASDIAASIGITDSVAGEEYVQAIQTNSATGAVETKFINADGNEMVLTEEQRKEIMSQLNQENVGGTVMVLQDDEAAAVASLQQQQGDAEQEEEAVKSSQDDSHETEEEEYDDSQIYNELATEQQQQQKIPDDKLLEKETEDGTAGDGGLEWAENLLSGHDDMEEEATAPEKLKESDLLLTKTTSKRDVISEKLKEITGDWTDEEEEEDHDDVGHEQPDEIEEVVQQGPLIKEPEGSTLKAQNVGAMSKPDQEENIEIEKKSLTPDEDDIDLALKNLHTESPISQLKEESGASSNSAQPNEENKSIEIIEKEGENTTVELEKNDHRMEKIKEETLKEQLLEVMGAKTENDGASDVNEDSKEKLLDELMTESGVPHDEDAEQDESIHQVNDKATEIFKIEKQTTEKLNESDEMHAPDTEENLNKFDVDVEENKDDISLNQNKAEKTIKSLISEWAEEDEDDDMGKVFNENIEPSSKLVTQKPQFLEEIIDEAAAAAEKSATSAKEEKVDV